MKKNYLVIGNPIDHSLSPKLHNYWLEKNKINGVYRKKLLNLENIKEVISNVRNDKIDGINVTVPFKKSVIPFVDKLSHSARITQSINTIYKQGKNIVGENTDIIGFEMGLKFFNYEIKNKKAFILGAGGVAPSIVLALKKMGASKIFLSNRTQKKAIDLKSLFEDIEIVEWGKIPEFDIIINATSLGLKKNDEVILNYNNITSNKFFYDVIYKPAETNFLKNAKKNGNKTENGKMMFIYQAYQSFFLWHKIYPVIDRETIKLIE